MLFLVGTASTPGSEGAKVGDRPEGNGGLADVGAVFERNKSRIAIVFLICVLLGCFAALLLPRTYLHSVALQSRIEPAAAFATRIDKEIIPALVARVAAGRGGEYTAPNLKVRTIANSDLVVIEVRDPVGGPPFEGFLSEIVRQAARHEARTYDVQKAASDKAVAASDAAIAGLKATQADLTARLTDLREKAGQRTAEMGSTQKAINDLKAAKPTASAARTANEKELARLQTQFAALERDASASQDEIRRAEERQKQNKDEQDRQVAARQTAETERNALLGKPTLIVPTYSSRPVGLSAGVFVTFGIVGGMLVCFALLVAGALAERRTAPEPEQEEHTTRDEAASA